MSFKGKFVWYELMTTDMPGAEKFYTQVVGWTAKDAGMPQMKYTLMNAGDIQVAGFMPVPMPNMPPSWIGYIAVADVDAEAASIKADGGAIHKEPTDIPGIGRFAVVADPQGVGFALFSAAGMDAPPAPPPGALGHAGWRELHAIDGAKAWDFYAKHFGWTKGDAMPMGPAGVYQIFNIDGDMAGGMMTKMPEMPVAAWLYYFNVDSAEAAAARIKAAGGTVINGPMEVPGGQWIVHGLDPQGGMFALVSMKK
jgi:predicted enzyme related to lactoylglutathione lyase